MATNDTDRRRFLVATALTLAALPALWWANQQADSGAPNVATVGIDVGDGAASGPNSGPESGSSTSVAGAPATTPPPVTTTPPTADSLDPSAPIFLEGPSGVAGAATGAIATPAAPDVEHITTSASYNSAISPTDTCLVMSNIPTGATITVTNLNNGHSTTCTATRVYSIAETGLIMFTDTFAQIADLTDAPIPVEISQ